MNKKTTEKKPALTLRSPCLDAADTCRHEKGDARNTLIVFHRNKNIFTETIKWSHLCEHV